MEEQGRLFNPNVEQEIITEELGTLSARNRTFSVNRVRNTITVVEDGEKAHAFSLKDGSNYARFLEAFVRWATTIYRPLNPHEAAALIIKVQNAFTRSLTEC